MTIPQSNQANWVKSRMVKTSDALDRAFEEGLTGQVFTGRDGKCVHLQDETDAVEFVSCSYLGLESHPALINAATEAISRFGVHFSSARNRMRPPYLKELEDALADIYHGSTALCFTSVSNVHLGVLPLLGSGSLPSYPIDSGGCVFLVEKTAHSSMQFMRGIMEQVGLVQRFDLHDLDTLYNALRNAASAQLTPIVLVDGIGSMGGLIDVVSLREAITPFNGYLYIDDAHGISIAGEHGAGYAFTAFGNQLPSNVIIAGSLSKGFGGSGGFAVIAAFEDMIVMRKFANTLVFGHSIMLPLLAANVASAHLHLNGEVAALQNRLWHNTAHFDALTQYRLVNAGKPSPIRGALFSTEEKALSMARKLRAAGILVIPAFFPTVAQGTGLIRFGLSSLHQEDQLEKAAYVLNTDVD